MFSKYRDAAHAMGAKYVEDLFALRATGTCDYCGETRAVCVAENVAPTCANCIAENVVYDRDHGLVSDVLAEAFFGGRYVVRMADLVRAYVVGVAEAARAVAA